eukprot:EG_transcript_28560
MDFQESFKTLGNPSSLSRESFPAVLSGRPGFPPAFSGFVQRFPQWTFSQQQLFPVRSPPPVISRVIINLGGVTHLSECRGPLQLLLWDIQDACFRPPGSGPRRHGPHRC